ncbi:SH3 domain-containing protein [Tolypocladium capitatum]|uniref:SH3 domain-containing protein n=1 Tax=Tolypocladium capitatum TaxID=45235 RepID=A0A2K3QPD4_9HYPO|nr:SH3 domain-containing protein [Tolypocladium capitatum]
MAAPFRVKAVYEYSSPHDDDLNFAVGQIITVTEEEDDDWYSGEYVDDDGAKREGIFPRNFVEKFEPTAPPRPTRTRTKKEPEAAQHPPAEEIAAPPPPLPGREDLALTKPEAPETEEADELVQRSSVVERAAPAVPPSAPSKPAEPVPTPASPPAAPRASEHAAAAPIPVPSSAPKAKPAASPPTAEKPASNSFRDRIAAFNKPAAPPVAPFKPGGLGGSGGGAGFIKKPFVAPPPSRNAYVPPPREAPPSATVYRREEDPEIKEREAENLGQAEKAGLVPAGQQPDAGEDDQPKPTSLKERIALLQKQQMEQAQRHAEAAAKKDKPKPKPPKKRTESAAPADAAAEAAEGPQPPSLERKETEETGARTSTDEVHSARVPPPPRRKSSKGHVVESVHDGNEADMSGAGDTTEGQDDTTERDDSDETSRRVSRAPASSTAAAAAGNEGEDDEDDEQVEEEEEDVDPEVKRKEELRARMAKMSGGMGFHGMFGAPVPPTAAAPKRKTPKAEAASIAGGEEVTNPVSRGAPPIPTPMAMPFMGNLRLHHEPTHPEEDEPVRPLRGAPPPVPTRPADDADRDEEEEEEATPRRDINGPPPVPGGRPAPPVPSEARPPPPPADIKSPTDGSESDDELSAQPPPIPPQPLQPPGLPAKSPPLSPHPEKSSPTNAPAPASKRNSRLPPPIPGSAPVPPPAQGRPPPPPPPGGLSRQSTADMSSAPPVPSRPHQAGEGDDEEVTEYEGDYDTDMASSVPHKDALKAHARESSLEDNAVQSPIADAPANLPPPMAAASAPRAVPPPIPTQPPPGEGSKRRSVDIPRVAPPPPPAKEAPTAQKDDDYDPYNYTASYSHKTPVIGEETYPQGPSPALSPPDRRAPPAGPGGRARQSLDIPRTSTSNRRSVDLHHPSMESGFIANDMELAVQSGWWKQANQVPPVLQGRKDIHFECEEATSTSKGSRTIVSRQVFVLFQDYSQTILSVRYDAHDPSEVELEQRHEPPPRALRQDQMEEFYERFGRQISEAATSKKDSVVADGTPQGLVLELLRPLKDALWPVGTRSYGALVYANMANASTQQNDVIRAGDIMSIRNAKFQGKHGPMHAKYSAEVGRPDHVAVVAEWDGTKKKVRAWEQGREGKKVRMESFKLDDLRSGEVKIWRVVPRSWVGWNSQP